MAIEPLILLNGTTADANDVMSLFNEIYSNIDNSNIASNAGIAFSKLQALTVGKIIVGNGSSVPAAVTMHGAATIDTTGLVTLSSSGSGGVVPIGTVIPFLDYNGLNTFDTTSWKMMDGTLIGLGPMAGQSTEDLSGRYLIGFGTDGGGNIGSTPWAVGAVGNAGSQINIQHTHTENVHNHSVPGLSYSGTTGTGTTGTGTTGTGSTGTGTTGDESLHTHPTPNHQHLTDFTTTSEAGFNLTNLIGSLNSDGSALVSVSTISGPIVTHRYFLNQTQNSGGGTSGAGSVHNHSAPSLSVPGLSVPGLSVPGLSFSGTTGTGTTGNQSDTGMSNSLSTTQDIRPSSIRCRYLLRIN